jgi:hypothetical protein
MDLDVGIDTVTVKWRGDNCSMLFEAQGYSIGHLQGGNYSTPEIRIRENSDIVKILSNELSTIARDAIYYRLVSVFDNGTICSFNDDTFYTFNGML